MICGVEYYSILHLSGCCMEKIERIASTIFGSARLKVTAEEYEFCSAFRASLDGTLELLPEKNDCLDVAC